MMQFHVTMSTVLYTVLNGNKQFNKLSPPSPRRPGGCAVQGSHFSSSNSLPDEVLNFVKTHPLMDETVPLLGHRPWVVKTMGRYRLHSLGQTSGWKTLRMSVRAA